MTEQVPAGEAFALVGRLWAALAADDDAKVREIVLETTLARMSWELPAAARMRMALGVDVATCSRIVRSTTVRRTGDGSVIVLAARGSPWGLGHRVVGDHGPEQIDAWPLLVCVVDGWPRVWGSPSDNEYAEAEHEIVAAD